MSPDCLEPRAVDRAAESSTWRHVTFCINTILFVYGFIPGLLNTTLITGSWIHQNFNFGHVTVWSAIWRMWRIKCIVQVFVCLFVSGVCLFICLSCRSQNFLWIFWTNFLWLSADLLTDVSSDRKHWPEGKLQIRKRPTRKFIHSFVHHFIHPSVSAAAVSGSVQTDQTFSWRFDSVPSTFYLSFYLLVCFKASVWG